MMKNKGAKEEIPLLSMRAFPDKSSYRQYSVYRTIPLTPDELHESRRKLARLCLVLYLVGLGTYVTHLASVIVSLHMVRKGYIEEKSSTVIGCSVVEIIAWCFVASFIWYSGRYCDIITESPDTCHIIWWGWFSLIVWYPIVLGCGIPRLIFTVGNNQEDS